MIRTGISTKLTLVFVFFAIILLISLAIPVYNNGSDGLKAAITSELLSTAIEKQSALDTWAVERLTDLVTISQHSHLIADVEILVNPLATTDSTIVSRMNILNDLQLHTAPGKNFGEIMIIAADSGQVILSTDPAAEGTFKEDQPYYINGKNGPFFQTLYISPALQSPAMTVSAPILTANGRLLGILAARLNLAEMQAIIDRRTGLRQSDDSYLVNTSNLFATQPRLLSNPAVLQQGIHTQAVNSCLQHNSGVAEEKDYRGISAITVYRWLPSQKLCLVVQIDQMEALAPVRSLASTMALVGGLLLLFGSIAAYTISKTITRPIQQLVIGTDEMGKGNLDYRIGLKSQDEIGQLGGSFDRMAENLKSTLVSRDDLVKEVKERKRAEVQLKTTLNDLERSNKELEQFAYVASHDLQEPLRMVASYTQLLERRYKEKLDGDARDFINFAVAGANRMQMLITDLLSFSRVGTRGKPMELTDSHIALGQARINLNAAIEETQAVVTNDDLPEVMADESQLVQLFQNLVGNAIKFHNPGESPRVHISATRNDKDWVFSVRDNGIGIDPKYFERLFVIFQRLHSRDEYPGTGIGLAVCKKIVERHGGKIWIESQAGKGSTFNFTLKKTDLEKNNK
jgi:signal transduction histidine kinase